MSTSIKGPVVSWTRLLRLSRSSRAVVNGFELDVWRAGGPERWRFTILNASSSIYLAAKCGYDTEQQAQDAAVELALRPGQVLYARSDRDT
jgi:hypothetical protein